MPNEVDYLPVANGPGSIAESQATWVSDLEGPLVNGFPSGILTSPRFNKVIRQSSMIAAAVANFIANQLNINVLDDGNLSELQSNLTNAVASSAQGAVNLANYETTANAASTYAPLASPNLTGNPTAPTQASDDNSTKLATTGFVATAIAAVQAWVNGLGLATQAWVESWVSSLGYATQAWANTATQNIVTGSRGLGTVYQNTSGRRMMVTASFWGNDGTGLSAITAKTDSSSTPSSVVVYVEDGNDSSITLGHSITFMVLPGNYYQITSDSSITVNSWTEWTF